MYIPRDKMVDPQIVEVQYVYRLTGARARARAKARVMALEKKNKSTFNLRGMLIAAGQ